MLYVYLLFHCHSIMCKAGDSVVPIGKPLWRMKSLRLIPPECQAPIPCLNDQDWLKIVHRDSYHPVTLFKYKHDKSLLIKTSTPTFSSVQIIMGSLWAGSDAPVTWLILSQNYSIWWRSGSYKLDISSHDEAREMTSINVSSIMPVINES